MYGKLNQNHHIRCNISKIYWHFTEHYYNTNLCNTEFCNPVELIFHRYMILIFLFLGLWSVTKPTGAIIGNPRLELFINHNVSSHLTSLTTITKFVVASTCSSSWNSSQPYRFQIIYKCICNSNKPYILQTKH